MVNHKLLRAVFALEINVDLFASLGIFLFRAVPATAQREPDSFSSFADDSVGGWRVAGLPVAAAGTFGHSL